MATKKTGNPVGRPSLDTPETRRKIEEAAALDASPGEIAFYADISRDTYDRILKNDPIFAERIAKLREKPILMARQRVIKGIQESYANAADYLKRKRRKEFGDSSTLEVEAKFTITNESREKSRSVIARVVGNPRLGRQD